MSGHSHWKQIKLKKGGADQKRGALFSKLLRAVVLAARSDPNPQFNPKLKAVIDRAKQANVPSENIERAIKKVSTESKNLEEIVVEAYGPGGAALIIEAITDNRNRTIQEIKSILKDLGGRFAEPGSVRWVFQNKENDWQPNFKQELGEDDKNKTQNLIESLENQDDVQGVFSNI